MEIHCFTFNPFQENTYLILSDDKGIIVDPGMSNQTECQEIEQILDSEGVTLEAIWLTHAHIDHVLGCDYLKGKYGLPIYLHKDDLPTLQMSETAAKMYGIPYEPCPQPDHFWHEGIKHWQGHDFEVRLIPGHAPGHVVFIHHENKEVIVGDVIFKESIGRTDLPGGNHKDLLNGIAAKIYDLPDDYELHPGHGPSTTVGHEKRNNPFINTES